MSHTTNGNLTGNPPLVTYEPTQGFIGTDSFTFIANDGVSNSSNIGFIKIITGDQAPVAENKTVRMLNINPVTIYLPAEDPENDHLTFSLISNTSKGNITQFDKDGGSLTYEPNHTFSGNDSFTFKG